MRNDELPEGWTEAPFGAVTVDPVQRVPASTEEITYIDIGSVDRDTKTITQPQTMLGKDAPSRARKVIKTGDVLVSTVRPNLNAVALVDRKYDGQFASTGFDVLRSPVLDPRWVFFSVRTPAFVERMTELVQGALYPAVRSKDVRAFTIPIAPLAEQKRIADKLEAVLGRVDACRARLDRVPDLLKRFRQSVLAAATSGQLTEAPEDGIPNGWKKVPFEDLLADKDKLSYGVLKPGDHDTDGVPMYRVVDIGAWGKRNETERSYISKALSREFTRTIVEEGDILLSVMATIGRAMVATKDMAGANVNRALAVIKPDRAKVDSSFLMYYFLSPALVTEFEERSLGSAQVRINLGDLRQFLINLPPLSEQVEIVRRVEALFAMADRIEARLAAARAQVERLTPATLSKAFRGDLVPQDPNDEPASKLLERLQPAFGLSKKRTAK